jgi:glutamate 5-kinase
VRWVVKVGSSTLVDSAGRLRRNRLRALAGQVSDLHRRGIRPALVISGAVAVGRAALGRDVSGDASARRAAAAALGQPRLTAALEWALASCGLGLGQILVTEASPGPSSPTRLFDALVGRGVIPMVNGNDATGDPALPDNDTLAAQLARAWPADLLVILTDQEGLLTDDPRRVERPPLVEWVPAVTPELWARVRGAAASGHGRGGMESKLLACGHVASAGIPAVIAPGHRPDTLSRIAAGDRVGTRVGAWPYEKGA